MSSVRNSSEDAEAEIDVSENPMVVDAPALPDAALETDPAAGDLTKSKAWCAGSREAPIVEGKHWAAWASSKKLQPHGDFLQATFNFAGDGKTVSREKFEALNILLGAMPHPHQDVQQSLDIESFKSAIREYEYQQSAVEAVGFATGVFPGPHGIDACIQAISGNYIPIESTSANAGIVETVVGSLDRSRIWPGYDDDGIEADIDWQSLWHGFADESVQHDEAPLHSLTSGEVLRRFRAQTDGADLDGPRGSNLVYVLDEDGNATDTEGQVRVYQSDQASEDMSKVITTERDRGKKFAVRPQPNTGIRYTFAALQRQVTVEEVKAQSSNDATKGKEQRPQDVATQWIVFQKNSKGALERRVYRSAELWFTKPKEVKPEQVTPANWAAGQRREVFSKSELISEIVKRRVPNELDRSTVLNLFAGALKLLTEDENDSKNHTNLKAKLTPNQMAKLWEYMRRKNADTPYSKAVTFFQTDISVDLIEREVQLATVSEEQFMAIMKAFEGDINVDEESLTAALVGFGSSVTMIMLMYTFVATKAVASLLCYKSCGYDWVDRGDSEPLRCDSEEYAQLWRISMAVTIFFVFGLPIFIFYKLWCRSELIQMPNLRPSEFFHFKLTWGWLFTRYRSECWWWEAKVLTHKLLASVIASALVDHPTRAVGALLGLQIVALAVHIPMDPYPTTSMNALETMFLLIELINAGIAYNAIDGGEISWFWEYVITALNVGVLLPVVPDMFAMVSLLHSKLSSVFGQLAAQQPAQSVVASQCAAHRNELLGLLVFVFAVAFNIFIVSIGISVTTEDFPATSNVSIDEPCSEGWTKVTLVACKEPEKDLDGGESGDWDCQHAEWITSGSKSFASGECVGRFTIQPNTVMSCTACADGFAMVETDNVEGLCRSCAPAWMVTLSISISIFLGAPVVAWMMNSFQLWMAHHTGSHDGLNDAANVQSFLSLVRTFTSVITHLQLTQLQLSLKIPWPAALKRVVAVITWPFTFKFDFITSTEAFCWASLVSPDMQLLSLLAIPTVLAMSSFLIAYIPNRKEVVKSTKTEKTKKRPLRMFFISCVGAIVGCCERGETEDPVTTVRNMAFKAAVLFGVIFLGKNLMCGLQWLGDEACTTQILHNMSSH